MSIFIATLILILLIVMCVYLNGKLSKKIENQYIDRYREKINDDF